MGCLQARNHFLVSAELITIVSIFPLATLYPFLHQCSQHQIKPLRISLFLRPLHTRHEFLASSPRKDEWGMLLCNPFPPAFHLVHASDPSLSKEQLLAMFVKVLSFCEDEMVETAKDLR